ncbi:uncharacterized protein FSUBG_9607 [Fusarium subglutinans]|uniref:Uncharacterized protein n=1 Tax=Gibberella subglutinans TaxID=42677 RepID=A0A8H5UQP4_GIBSU|nr:uncharacterized protein FSUBG_9607 [Fusarium subglutinans]KAF5594034.1 hypothetical protein FSUBG_9607 [Fusarium subglutinans]
MKASVLTLPMSFAGLSMAVDLRSDIPEGYTIVPMTWVGPIEEGGKSYTFKGTAEEVLAQIEKLNPNFAEFADSKMKDDSSKFYPRISHLTAQTRVACDGGGPNGGQSMRTKVSDARQGIDHLKRLGDFGCGAPARSCARMTCNWQSAIWFCNDNDYEVSDRCDWQGYLGELVIEKCQRHVKADCWVPNPVCTNCCQAIDTWLVMGAQYDVRNWNVMINGGC